MGKKKKQNTTKYAGSAFAVILAALLSYFPISKQLDDKKAAAKCERWQQIAEAAAKQSQRGIIPAIGPYIYPPKNIGISSK